MGDLSEQALHRIIGIYGEPFLRYVFALPKDTLLIEGLQATRSELVFFLQSAIDQLPNNGAGGIDVTFAAIGNFGSYRDDFGGSLANYLRHLAGGELQKIPAGKDPVVQAIRSIASDIWPVLLFTPPKRGPRTFWMSNFVGVFSHPQTLEACKAFMADAELTLLFPGAPSLKEAKDIGEVIEVQADWFVNSGHGGTQQLVSIIDSIIFNAAVLAQLDGSSLDHAGIMSKIPEVVKFFRKFATKKPVDVPVIIGFSGVQIPDGDGLEFGDDRLRSIRTVEKNLLLVESDRVTSVFETKFAVQLLDVSGPGRDGSYDFDKNWERHSPLMHEAYRTLQRRVDRVRLSVLLASQGSEYLATTEVTRFIADPTQRGGQSSWQMDQRVPVSYPLKDGQHEEVSHLYKLIREKHPESLDIAMRRILGAISQRWDATDAFIDAVVVWENAFGTQTETTFRVTGAISKLLESGNLSERAKLQKDLKDLYETRSRLIHGAKEPKPEDVWAQRERAIAVALDILRKLYTERPDLLELTSELRGSRLLLEG